MSKRTWMNFHVGSFWDSRKWHWTVSLLPFSISWLVYFCEHFGYTCSKVNKSSILFLTPNCDAFFLYSIQVSITQACEVSTFAIWWMCDKLWTENLSYRSLSYVDCNIVDFNIFFFSFIPSFADIFSSISQKIWHNYHWLIVIPFYYYNFSIFTYKLLLNEASSTKLLHVFVTRK